MVNEEYPSGAERHSEFGKGRYDLIPVRALRRLALRYEYGASSYSDPRNWEKGIPFSRMVSSAKRHVDQWIEGDSGEDHLAAACFNLFALMDYEERKLADSLDNLPDHLPVKRGNLKSVFGKLFEAAAPEFVVKVAEAIDGYSAERIQRERDVLESWAAQSKADEALAEIPFEDDPYWGWSDGEPSAEEEQFALAVADVLPGITGRARHEICGLCEMPRDNSNTVTVHTVEEAKSSWGFKATGRYAEGWRDEDELCHGSKSFAYRPDGGEYLSGEAHTVSDHPSYFPNIGAVGRGEYLGDWPNVKAGFRR